MKKILENKLFILIIGSITILILSLFLYLKNDNKEIKDDIVLNITTKKITTEKESFYVDVKGNVKNPGVYKFEENERVKDAIEKAGGLTKNANTNNINLSQKLHNEMVIYVYSNNDIKNNNKILDCNTICETNVIEINNCIEDTNNKLININTATIEELLTLTGIGESKAKNIIEYRETNGNFKTIDELKNISGIGESLFDNIKDKITI